VPGEKPYAKCTNPSDGAHLLCGRSPAARRARGRRAMQHSLEKELKTGKKAFRLHVLLFGPPNLHQGSNS
jgi:hypothetical protein